MLLRKSLSSSFLQLSTKQPRVYTFSAVAFALLFSACGGTSTSSELTSNTTVPFSNDVPDSSAAIDGTERNLVNADVVPAPSNLALTNLRSGFVTLQWDSSEGDINQQQPNGDSVSYYRVYRNGELLVDTFSPAVEDPSAPVGDAVYSVEAVKFVTEPEYGFIRSSLVEVSVQIPSAAQEAANFNGSEIDVQQFDAALSKFKDCAISFAGENMPSLCVNPEGYAWPIHANNVSADLFHNTVSVAGDVMVSVQNKAAELGPIPGTPTWTLKILSTGESIRRDLKLVDENLSGGEGYVVNGAAVADDGTVYISGTLYQSYLPRSLAPSADLLPVTNAYYIAQIDYSTGDQIQFKRFTLTESPGALASVNNGTLELHQAGKVAWYSAQGLTQISSVSVTGYPIFSDQQFIYTESFDPDKYYRFTR